MTLQKNTQLVLAALVGVIALAVLMTINVMHARGALTNDQPAIANQYRTYEFFQSSTTASVMNGVIATSTGTAISTNFTSFYDQNGVLNDGTLDIRGVKKVSLFFTRGGAFGANGIGTTTFTVEVSPDFGTTWYSYTKLVQSTSTSVSNTMTQPNAIIGDTSGIAADATSTLRFSMDLSTEGFSKMRCKAVTTVDGSASCMAAATY